MASIGQTNSRAWSMGKTDRCKFKIDLIFLYLILNLLVKITAEIKRNNETRNVAPGTYLPTMKDKRQEPQYSMGGRYESTLKLNGPSPASYNIPTKITESPGKTIAMKLKGSMESNTFAPGPGAYDSEK